MSTSNILGSLVRETRKREGITQAALAERCQISASYLNLIEHGKRRIGGALLNRLAEALGMDARELSAGAGEALVGSLQAAAARHAAAGADTARIEEFAGRFPGWAKLVSALERSESRLSETVGALSDRMAHDPFLSAAVHDMLSSVTSIRSTSAILREDDNITPEWQARFHRNISEDSERLSEGVARLVRHMDASAAEAAMRFPEEEVDGWLAERDWAIPELDQNPGRDLTAFVGATGLETGAKALLREVAGTYARDAAALPRQRLIDTLGEETDLARLTVSLGVSWPLLMRRLAALPGEAFPDGQPRGLVSCDAAGALRFRKPLPGFDVPRFGAACPRWPLYEALTRPGVPVSRVAQGGGRDPRRFTLVAFAELSYPDGLDAPPVATSHMLIAPLQQRHDAPALTVGATCRVCAAAECPARREAPLVPVAAPL